MYLRFLYLATILIWGTTWFAIKFQLGIVAPEVSLLYRFGLAAVILVGFCLFSGKSLAFSLCDHLFVAGQGACLFSINYLIFYIATGMLTSGLVAVVFSSVIFMNMFNGWLFLGRSVERIVILGASLGLFGITLVFWPELSTDNGQTTSLTGLILCVVATYCASLGNILSARNQQAGLAVVPTNALGMAYGALLMLLFVLVSGSEFKFDFSVEYVLSLLYLSVFGSILAFGAYLTLIGRIGADRAAYATVLFPIVALLISWWFEDYQWTFQSLLGIAIVLVGNTLLTGRRWRGKTANTD